MTRTFTDFLGDVAGGVTEAELTEALAAVTAAVKDTGKKGSLTYTVIVEPLKNGGGALVVTDQVKSTVPKHDRRKNIFFADAEGNLTRNNPLQPTFEEVQEVPVDTTVVDIATKKDRPA